MPRAVAFSAKQKRAYIKDKRAAKRGELDAEDIRLSAHHNRSHKPGHRDAVRHRLTDSNGRLKSSFLALSPEYIDRSREMAYTQQLVRPIPDEAAVFPVDILRRDEGQLRCPVRPAFSYDMSKEEVLQNEAEYFDDWLSQTEDTVDTWVSSSNDETSESSDALDAAQPSIRSPTWFETNPEVWRQL